MKLDGCSALITGASAGIGREFARQLAPHCQCLVLVARRTQRLEDLRDELTKSYPKLGVYIRTVDLSVGPQIDALIEWLKQEKIDISVLINNAGLGDLGPFEASDPERVESMMSVNINAVTLLTRHLLPSMIANKRGAILNVSSSAGFLPIPGFAVYAASKAYVTSFSEALRAELHDTGVSVCALCPGPVPTEFSDVAQRPGQSRDRSPEIAQVTVEDVVCESMKAIEAGRPIVVPGLVMKIGMFLIRLTPMPVLRLAWRFTKLR